MATKKKPARRSARSHGKGRARKTGTAKRKGAAAKRKGSTKRGAKKPAAKQPAAKPASLGPQPVKTGRGPSPMEVATTVLALLRDGRYREVEDAWLAPSIVSVEGVGASMAWSGKKAVLEKYRTWEGDHDINEMNLEGPWVGATGFAIKFKGDVTQRSTGQRMQLEEIAVYTVKDGKIVREEFHFATGA